MMVDTQTNQAIKHIARVIKDTAPEEKQAEVQKEVTAYLEDFATALDLRIDAKLQAFEKNMLKGINSRR